VNASASLLDRVIEASGLMEMIAPFTIRRLLISADVSPQELTQADLRRAMPQLERGLGVYLDSEQLDSALAELRRLAGE
jgi:hypothetical protein